jgi:hypothetical protein
MDVRTNSGIRLPVLRCSNAVDKIFRKMRSNSRCNQGEKVGGSSVDKQRLHNDRCHPE